MVVARSTGDPRTWDTDVKRWAQRAARGASTSGKETKGEVGGIGLTSTSRKGGRGVRPDPTPPPSVKKKPGPGPLYDFFPFSPDPAPIKIMHLLHITKVGEGVAGTPFNPRGGEGEKPPTPFLLRCPLTGGFTSEDQRKDEGGMRARGIEKNWGKPEAGEKKNLPALSGRR